MQVELALDAQAELAESPIWHARENALYWADIKAPALHRLHPATGATRTWPLPAQIGAYAFSADNRTLLALRTGLHWLDLATGALILLHPPPFDPNLIRFNDGLCDSAGRFWIGTMTDPPAGQQTPARGLLYSFTTAAGLTPHPDVSLITNGMAFNADESLLYLADSAEATVYTYAFDPACGVLGEKRVFAKTTPPAVPDGAAVDAEGAYWCALHGGGRLHRYLPDGALDRVIPLPVSQPTMCCFAGPALDLLYITSARANLAPAALVREPHAGGLFRLRPPVPGLPKPIQVI